MPAKKSKKKPRNKPSTAVKKSTIEDLETAEERIAKIFHLAQAEDGDEDEDEDEELPPVTDETLETYYQYLKNNLVLPFTTIYKQEVGFLQEHEYKITVINILNPAQSVDSDFYGIFITAKTDTGRKVLPLADLELDADDENYLLIDDYSLWFWNYRE